MLSKAPEGWDLGPTVDAPGADAAPAGEVVTFVEAALSGEEIVGQLYGFTDKGGREVALRP